MSTVNPFEQVEKLIQLVEQDYKQSKIGKLCGDVALESYVRGYLTGFLGSVASNPTIAKEVADRITHLERKLNG